MGFHKKIMAIKFYQIKLAIINVVLSINVIHFNSIETEYLDPFIFSLLYLAKNKIINSLADLFD